MTVSIIFDGDPGHDDVIAIVLASRLATLVSISTVAGNAPLEATTHNALVTTQIFDLDVPVYAGCPRPLVAPPAFAAAIHGTSGLGGPVLPPLTRQVAAGHGVQSIIQASHDHPGSWLVATGPLTNVALALRLDPSLGERLAGISIMGGSTTFGNWSPAAEFNIRVDPEAADIVFGSGIPLRMCGLNVTHQVLMTHAEEAEIRAVGGPRATFVADLLGFFAEAYKSYFFADAAGPLHDPLAVLAITHPELFSLEALPVSIELTGTHTRGMTLVDQRRVKGAAVANCDVAVDCDGEAIRRRIVETVIAACRS